MITANQALHLTKLAKEYADAEAVSYYESDQGWGKSPAEAKSAAEAARLKLNKYIARLTQK